MFGLVTLRAKHLGCGDGLANVALCVISDVDKKSANAGGKLLLADEALFLQLGYREGAYATDALAEANHQFRKKLIAGGAGIRLALQGRHLVRGKLSAFRICKQAINTAGDMAKVKCHRWDTSGTGIEFGITQAFTPAFKVFTGQFQRVQNCPLHRRDFGKGAAQPGFRLFNLKHSLTFLHMKQTYI
jgi:hypothetical protein